jgi:hypothetical protein
LPAGCFWTGVAEILNRLLGPVGLLAQRTLPYPWANLANSAAVWAIAGMMPLVVAVPAH